MWLGKWGGVVRGVWGNGGGLGMDAQYGREGGGFGGGWCKQSRMGSFRRGREMVQMSKMGRLGGGWCKQGRMGSFWGGADGSPEGLSLSKLGNVPVN